MFVSYWKDKYNLLLLFSEIICDCGIIIILTIKNGMPILLWVL
jgi:hypothetical protein